MPKTVAGATQRDQVPGIVGASFCAWNDVVDIQKSGVVATLATAAVSIAGQDFAADAGRNGGCVALAGLVDLGIAPGSFNLGSREFQFTMR